MSDKFSRDEKIAACDHACGMIDDATKFVAHNPELETDVYMLRMSQQLLHRELAALGILTRDRQQGWRWGINGYATRASR
jgi:hypothetical protein